MRSEKQKSKQKGERESRDLQERRGRVRGRWAEREANLNRSHVLRRRNPTADKRSWFFFFSVRKIQVVYKIFLQERFKMRVFLFFLSYQPSLYICLAMLIFFLSILEVRLEGRGGQGSTAHIQMEIPK